MTTLLRQLELALTAAALLAAGLGFLYLGLGLWGMVLDRSVRLIGLHAAFLDFLLHRSNRDRWWRRFADSVGRFVERKNERRTERDCREDHGWD